MDKLFEITREGNEDKFVKTCKEQVADVAIHSTSENGNPFHIAASQRILLPALKKIMKDLEESTRSRVEKAKEAKDWGEVKRLEKELKNNKKYIKEALCDKSYIKDNKAVSPLYCP